MRGWPCGDRGGHRLRRAHGPLHRDLHMALGGEDAGSGLRRGGQAERPQGMGQLGERESWKEGLGRSSSNPRLLKMRQGTGAGKERELMSQGEDAGICAT